MFTVPNSTLTPLFKQFRYVLTQRVRSMKAREQKAARLSISHNLTV